MNQAAVAAAMAAAAQTQQQLNRWTLVLPTLLLLLLLAVHIKTWRSQQRLVCLQKQPSAVEGLKQQMLRLAKQLTCTLMLGIGVAVVIRTAAKGPVSGTAHRSAATVRPGLYFAHLHRATLLYAASFASFLLVAATDSGFLVLLQGVHPCTATVLP